MFSFPPHERRSRKRKLWQTTVWRLFLFDQLNFADDTYVIANYYLPCFSHRVPNESEFFSADFAGTAFIQLYLYAHRVDGLQSGVYRLWRERAELEQIKSGDQRVQAAGLSLGQDLAGNACVAFSMIGDIERAARAHGDRGYRYVHFEAGAIGHRLYLAAEALGLGATGIGAFYDDSVHDYLNVAPEQGQVVYHFAIGHPVPDPRLET